MKKSSLLILIFCLSCSNKQIGSLEHLNFYENSYFDILKQMKYLGVEVLDIDSTSVSKHLLTKNGLKKVYIINKKDDKIVYYSFGYGIYYCYIIYSKNTITEYSFCKDKFTKIKDKWYYLRKTPFGCVE